MVLLAAGVDKICGYKFDENGSVEFTNQLDSLDLNGHTEPEYRAAKVIFLEWVFKGMRAEDITADEIANILICSKILTDGPEVALHSGKIEPINVYLAIDKLGFNDKPMEELLTEVYRLSDKIDEFRDIVTNMAEVELFYTVEDKE